MAAGGAAGPGGGSGAGGAGARAPLWGREWEKGWRSAAHPPPHPPGSQPGLFPPEPPRATGWMGADGLWEGGGRGERAGARRGFICKVPPPLLPARCGGQRSSGMRGGARSFPFSPLRLCPPRPQRGSPPGAAPPPPPLAPCGGLGAVPAARGAGPAPAPPPLPSPSHLNNV